MKQKLLLIIFTLIAVSLTAQVKLDSALTNYYPLNGNGLDASGRKQDATIKGTIPTIDRFGEYSKALLLLGDGDLITFEHHNLGETGWSYSIWVKLDILPSLLGDAFLLSYANVGFGDDVHLFIDDKDNTLKSYAKATNNLITTNVVFEKKKWYHIVLTYSKDYTKIYVNGQLKSSSTGRFSNNTSNVELAVSSIYPGEVLKGRIFGSVDDIRLYKYVLSATEAGELHNKEITNEIISGINTHEKSNLRIYSSSASRGNIYIESDDLINKIEVFDINGKSLFYLTPNNFSHQFSNVAKGIYIVKVATEQQTAVRRVIVN